MSRRERKVRRYYSFENFPEYRKFCSSAREAIQLFLCRKHDSSKRDLIRKVDLSIKGMFNCINETNSTNYFFLKIDDLKKYLLDLSVKNCEDLCEIMRIFIFESKSQAKFYFSMFFCSLFSNKNYVEGLDDYYSRSVPSVNKLVTYTLENGCLEEIFKLIPEFHRHSGDRSIAVVDTLLVSFHDVYHRSFARKKIPKFESFEEVVKILIDSFLKKDDVFREKTKGKDNPYLRHQHLQLLQYLRESPCQLPQLLQYLRESSGFLLMSFQSSMKDMNYLGDRIIEFMDKHEELDDFMKQNDFFLSIFYLLLHRCVEDGGYSREDGIVWRIFQSLRFQVSGRLFLHPVSHVSALKCVTDILRREFEKKSHTEFQKFKEFFKQPLIVYCKVKSYFECTVYKEIEEIFSELYLISRSLCSLLHRQGYFDSLRLKVIKSCCSCEGCGSTVRLDDYDLEERFRKIIHKRVIEKTNIYFEEVPSIKFSDCKQWLTILSLSGRMEIKVPMSYPFVVSSTCKRTNLGYFGKKKSTYNIPILSVCDYCGERGDVRRCSKCGSAFYCNRECQVKDWENHKKTCERLKRNSCKNCGSRSYSKKMKKCSRCLKVFYCSRECQKEDWRKGHKSICET